MSNFATHLLMLSAFVSVVNKGYAAGSESHSVNAGGSDVSPRRATDEDCLKQLTKSDEVELLGQLDRLQSSYFAGIKTAEQRDAAMVEMFKSLNPSHDPKREIALRARTLEAMKAAGTGPVMAILARTAKGEKPTARDLEMVKGLGAEKPDEYLQDTLASYGPYFKALFEKGVQFTDKGGFNFQNAQLNQKDIASNPTLQTALRLFVSAEVADKLLDPDRSGPVFLGESVISPPDSEGSLSAMSQADYQRRLKFHLDTLARETENFIRASKKANSYWESMQGRLWDRGERGPAEVEQDGAFSLMKRMMSGLREIGMTRELRDQVFAIQQEALKVEKGQIEDGYKTLNMAMAAAIAAPVIPLLIYAAPFAGAAAGISATSMTNASATMAAIPMVFSLGRSAIHAGIDYARNGGNPFCHAAKNAVEGGAQGLVGAAVGAALPLVPALAASGAAVYGAGAAAVSTTYGVVNLGVALGFFAYGANGVRKELTECYHALQSAKQNADQGQSELATSETTRAMKICTDAGVDLAFAVVSARQLAKQGAQVRDQLRAPAQAEGLLGRSLTPEQRVAVERAHRVGEGQPGRDGKNPAAVDNYTQQQLQEKYNILAEAGLSKAEIKKLMDNGVVGKPSPKDGNDKKGKSETESPGGASLQDRSKESASTVGDDLVQMARKPGVGAPDPVAKVRADDAPIYRVNSKHVRGTTAFLAANKPAVIPRNHVELYRGAIKDPKGNYWAKDANGNLHRFSTDKNNQSHWSGATSFKSPDRRNRVVPTDDNPEPIDWDEVPKEIQKFFY